MPENPIYDFLKANKLTDKDEATFLKEYSDSAKAKELYGFFQANKLTDKDFNGFYDTYLKKKETSGIGSLVGGKAGTSVPLSGKDNKFEIADWIKELPRKSFESKDPIRDAIEGERSKVSHIINPDVTSGKKSNINALEKLQTAKSLSDNIYSLENAFGDDTELAENYLQNELGKSRVKLKQKSQGGVPGLTNFISEQTPKSLSEHPIQTFSTEEIGKAIDPQNKTQVAAFNTLQRGRALRDAVSGGGGIDEMAAKFFGDDLMEMSEAKAGQKIDEFINIPQIKKLAESDNDFAQKYYKAKNELYDKYPSYAQKKVAQEIGQILEDEKMTGWLYANPSVKKTDKAVEMLIEKGVFGEKEKEVYDKMIRPYAVIGASDKVIPLTDLMHNAGYGIYGGFSSVNNTIRDVLNKTVGASWLDPSGSSLFQNLGLMESNKAKDKRLEQIEYGSPQVTPSTGFRDFIAKGSHFAGFTVPMILGGAAKIPQAATMVLMFEGDNADKARKMFPNDVGKQNVYTVLTTGIDATLAELLPTKKAADGVKRLLLKDVSSTIENLSSKKISEDVAKKELGERIFSVLEGVVKENTKAGIVLTAFEKSHNALNAAFGEGKFNISDEIESAIGNYKTNWLTGTFLSAASAAGKGMGTLDRGKIYLEMANNPDKYRELISREAKTNPQSAKEKLENLDHIEAIAQVLESQKIPIEKQGAYIELSLKQKAAQEKAAGSPDKVLAEKDKRIAAIAEIEQQRILNPEITNTEHIEKLFEHLPKGSQERLSVDGKFSPSKVGEYLKFIAQQSNGLDEKFKPLPDGKKPSMSEIPESIIEIANERWADEIESAQPKIDQVREIDMGTEEITKPIELDPNLPDDYKQSPTTKQQQSAVSGGEGGGSEISVGEMIDKTGTYKGEKGSFYQDGQTVVFKVEGKNKEYELGNISEIKDTPISDFGIAHEESVVSISDSGDIKVREQDYKNNYSNPLSAINKDADGNVVSVNLETAGGKKRTFRGNIAEDIAYQINLKEINKNNETRTEFEQHLNEDATASKEMDNGTVLETTKKEPVKNNEPVSREKVKSKQKSVAKEQSTKEGEQQPSTEGQEPAKTTVSEAEALPVGDVGKQSPPQDQQVKQEGGGEPPVIPPVEGKLAEESEFPERRFTKQMLRSDELSDASKEEIAKTLNYTRQTNEMTVKEANDVLDKVGVDEAQNLVMTDGELKPAVRVTLGQVVIKKYNDLSEKSTNPAEKEFYLDKTIQTATYVTEKLATEAGQSIQAFSMWSRLSPEGQLRAANQDMARQGKEKMARREKDINKIGDKFKKANEETVSEVVKNVGGNVKKTESARVSKAKDKVAKAKEKRKKLFDKYKKGKGGGLTLSTGGLTKEGIEYVGELAKTYIEEGVAKLEVAITEIIEHLKKIGANVNDDVKRNVSDILGKAYDEKENAGIRKKMISGLAQMEKEIGEIIRDHYTIPEKSKKKLVDKFIEEIGLEKDEAESLAKEVEAEFDKIATRKKRDILYNEKARFDKINSTLGGGKIEKKTVADELIKYTNLGAFENSDFTALIGKKFGVGEITTEQAAKLKELADKIQKAPEGTPKRDATEDLLAYRAKLRGNDLGETAQGVWYANILSGYRTHEKNIISTFFNSLGELGTEMLKDPKAIPYIMAGYFKGVIHRGRIEAGNTLKTGRSPIHIKKIETPNILERKSFKGGAINPANWFKYVMRMMVAEDVLSFQGLKEARAYQLARREAAKMGYNTWSAKGWNKVNEILYHTKERYESAKEQALLEGLTGKREIKRRVYELMEESRPQEMTQDAYGFAARGTFNHESEGSLGALTNAVAHSLDAVSVGGFKPLRLIVPFTRIITNVVNNSLDFTPIGLIRGARGVRGFKSFNENQYTKGAYKKLSREERQRYIVKASIGILFSATFQALHQAGVIQITGAGPEDEKKKKQLMQSGWQPYSIKIGNKYYSYQYTPLVFQLGFLGNMNDAAEYGGDDEATLTKKMELALSRMSGQVADMTWINSASTFLGALTEKGTSGQEKSVKDALAGTLRGAIPFGGAVTQGNQLVQNVFRMPQKQVNNSWQALIQDIPIARNSLNNKINALGDEITRDIDVFQSKETTDPVWKFLLDKKGWVAPPNRGTVVIFDQNTQQDRPLTDDEWYNFLVNRGKRLRSDIGEIIKNGTWVIRDGDVVIIPSKDLNEKELNRVLSRLESRATRLTKAEMFGEKEKDEDEESLQKELKMALDEQFPPDEKD